MIAIETEIVDSSEVDLRALGKDERWLHDWIIGDPTRLGLGQVEIRAHELVQSGNSGGRLDILACNASGDTFYEIEVMLGECDASHGFRTLDYWARQRAVNPNSRHYAVLVAENLQGRYKTILETLPQFIPFIGVEIHTLRLAGDPPQATIRPTIVCSPDDLLENSRQSGRSRTDELPLVPRDEEAWREAVSGECWQTMQRIFSFVEREIGPTRINYSPKSYVGLYKGSRCWCPMWPSKDGVRIYLPDAGVGFDKSPLSESRNTTEEIDEGDKDKPSSRFMQVKSTLALVGIETNWVCNYNAGANPVAFNVKLQDVERVEVQAVLKQAYGNV